MWTQVFFYMLGKQKTFCYTHSSNNAYHLFSSRAYEASYREGEVKQAL